MTYLTLPDEGGNRPPRPEPCLLLAPVDAREAASRLGRAYAGVVLADPRDLDGLLQRRPDLARPRGGRPCWVLLAWDEAVNPAGWARGWARVTAWAPAALPPVLVPRGVLPGQGRDGAPGRAVPAGRDPVSAAAGAAAAPAAGRGDVPCSGAGHAPLPEAHRAVLAGLGRARQALLRLLEEPVPVPVVLPAPWRPALAGGRAPAGLDDAPVWWLVPPG